MPTIFKPEDLTVIEKDGAKITLLANQDMLGVNAMQIEHIALETGSRTTLFESAEAERFMYVIRGKGQAHISEQVFPLNAESILWLEKGDTFYLEAGADGLEVLLYRSPGK